MVNLAQFGSFMLIPKSGQLNKLRQIRSIHVTGRVMWKEFVKQGITGKEFVKRGRSHVVSKF